MLLSTIRYCNVGGVLFWETIRSAKKSWILMFIDFSMHLTSQIIVSVIIAVIFSIILHEIWSINPYMVRFTSFLIPTRSNCYNVSVGWNFPYSSSTTLLFGTISGMEPKNYHISWIVCDFILTSSILYFLFPWRVLFIKITFAQFLLIFDDTDICRTLSKEGAYL